MATAIAGLTTDWLATRMGLQPAAVEGLRRSGELLGVRSADDKHVFPSWQFGSDGRPLPLVAPLVRAARAAGIDDGRLHRLVVRRIANLRSDRHVQSLVEDSVDQLLRRLFWRAS